VPSSLWVGKSPGSGRCPGKSVLWADFSDERAGRAGVRLIQAQWVPVGAGAWVGASPICGLRFVPPHIRFAR